MAGGKNYCIMNVDKQRRSAVYGLQIEANREQDDGREFPDSDIDQSRTNENIFLRKTESWNKEITDQIHQAGLKERKDSVVMITGVYTASPEWFDSHTEQEALDYFNDCLKYHDETYGKAFNAVIHMDEQTPHMQVASVPIIEDEKGAHLSAKLIMGDRQDYRLRQDSFYEIVGKAHDMERGERRDPHDRKAHMTKREYQKATLEEEIENLEERSRDSFIECRQMETKKAEMQAVNDNLQGENEYLQNTNNALEMQIDQNRLQLQENEKLREKRKAEIKELAKEKENTKQELESARKSAEKEKGVLRTAQEREKAKLGELQAQNKVLSQKLAEDTEKQIKKSKKLFSRGEYIYVRADEYKEAIMDARNMRSFRDEGISDSRSAAKERAQLEFERKQLEAEKKAIKPRLEKIKDRENYLDARERSLDQEVEKKAQKKFDAFLNTQKNPEDSYSQRMANFLHNKHPQVFNAFKEVNDQIVKNLQKSWDNDRDNRSR